MSNLNGESLYDWIDSEKKTATQNYYRAVDDFDKAFYGGVLDTLDTLKRKLQSGQVNPFGDRNLLSD